MTATKTEYSVITELQDAHEGIGGSKSNMPFLDWLKETAADDQHTMQDAAKRALDEIPELWVVKIKETEHWNKAFVKENKIKNIYGVYAFNRKKHVHACELTPSYEFNYLEKQVVMVDEDKEMNEDEQEEYERIRDIAEDEVRAASVQDDNVIYHHVRNVEDWIKNPKCKITERCGALPKNNIGLYKVENIDALEDGKDLIEEMYELSSNGL